MKTNTLNAQLKELFKGTSFEDYSYEDFESPDELIEDLQEQINQYEVIYYHNAIEYLKNNDASFHDSIALADELGYSLKDINSELLATLLQQQNLQEELSGLADDIKAIYEERGV